MGSFGERLRREREMRGVSLDDIADTTKIGTRLLRALEEEHFELLPGGIFNKGFVRAYSKYLGLNEDEMVSEYLRAAGDSAPDPRVIAEQNSSRIDRMDGDSGGSRMAGFPIIPVLILLIVIAAGAGGWHLYQERMRERQARADAERAAKASSVPPGTTPNANDSPAAATASPGTSGTTAMTNSHPAGAATSTAGPNTSPAVDLNKAAKPGEAPTAAGLNPGATSDKTKPATVIPPVTDTNRAGAVSPSAEPFEVAVRAKDRAWVSIKSDGKYAVRGLISPPDVKTVRATDQVIFFTGNAGAVEVSFNGQLIPLPGGPNTEGVLVFNSHGLVIPKPTSAGQER